MNVREITKYAKDTNRRRNVGYIVLNFIILTHYKFLPVISLYTLRDRANPRILIRD